MKVRIAPSLLSADFARLADALAMAEAGGADLVHVDVMDGHFVPNLTIGPPVVRALRKATRLPLDVHLMIENPERTLPEYLDAGVDWVSVHVESTRHLQRCLDTIRRGGARAGAALNPGTPSLMLASSWQDLDYAVVMSVNPGWGGQSSWRRRSRRCGACASSPGRPAAASRSRSTGEWTRATPAPLAAAGAEILVAGTAVYGHADPAAAIGQLREAASLAARV